jgi:hypothetical protein
LKNLEIDVIWAKSGHTTLLDPIAGFIDRRRIGPSGGLGSNEDRQDDHDHADPQDRPFSVREISNEEGHGHDREEGRTGPLQKANEDKPLRGEEQIEAGGQGKEGQAPRKRGSL